MPSAKKFPNREEWLAARAGARLGGSDAATCMDEGFEDPLTLWGRKTGKLPPQEDSMRFRFGQHAEPFIHEETVRELGLELLDPGQFTVFESDEDGRLFTTPDRLAVKSFPFQFMPVDTPPEVASYLLQKDLVAGAVSFKTVGVDALERWPANAPSRYAVLQLHHEMHVLGLQLSWVAALVGAGEDLRCYVVRRDNDLLGELLEAEHRMLRCIETDTPPEPGDSAKAAAALAKLFPQHQPTKAVELPAESAAEVEQWSQVKEQRLEAEKIERSLTNRFKAAMQDAEIATVEGRPDLGLTWRTQPGQKSLPLTEETRKLLVQMHPEFAEELTYQQGTSRVLREYKGK